MATGYQQTPAGHQPAAGETGNAAGGGEQKKSGGSGSKGSARGQMNTASYNFEGAKPEIGVVLGLKHERMKSKVMFDDFVETFTNYLTSNMTGARDVVRTITERDDTLERIDGDIPIDLTDEEAKSAVRTLLKTEEVKKFGTRRQQAIDNLVKVFGLIWGQCSSGLQTAIKGESGFDDAFKAHEVVWLLEAVQKIVSGVDTKANKLYIEQEALVVFTTMRQGTTEPTDGFITRVKQNAQTLKLAGGERYLYDKESLTTDDRANIDRAIEEYLAMHVLRRSDAVRFGDLQKSLLDGSHRGRDEYPTTLQDVYALMVRQPKEMQPFNRKGNGRGGTNVMFAMVSGDKNSGGDDDGERMVPGTDGKVVDNECFICRKKGHISWYCPEAGNTGPPSRAKKNYNCTQFGFVQRCGDLKGAGKEKSESSVINPNWILLDTCSTASVCCNRELVRDVRDCKKDEILEIVTNGGKQVYHQLAILRELPIQVHFKSDSLGNIVSLRDVANIPNVTITMDTSKERAITVKMGPYKEFKFLECPDGLYHYDTSITRENLSKTKSAFTPYSNSYSLATTVADNKKYFTKREISGAEGAQRLQQELGWPSVDQFRQIVANNLIRNSTVTIDDIDRAQHIFGTPTPLLQGKMIRSPNAKERVPRVSIPPAILTYHRNVILHVDFFFVNKLPFLHTKSEGINFLTVQTGNSRSKKAIVGGLTEVIKIYHTRGFKVRTIHGDGEFDLDYLRAKIMPINLEITGRDEHDGVIERSVRVVKERSRCTCNSLPYRYYPKIMTNSMVENVINWLNAFPMKSGISQTMGPSTIVLGKPAPDVSRKCAVFGSYVMGFTRTKNDMTERSEKAISLGTQKDSGAHYFMSLRSGKRIKCHRWEELPITQEIIDRVEDLAREENQIKLVNGIPLFEWEDGKEVEGIYENDNELPTIGDCINDDGENDSDYEPSDVDGDDVEEQIQGIEDVENNLELGSTENVVTDDEENDEESEDIESVPNLDENDPAVDSNECEVSETQENLDDVVDNSSVSNEVDDEENTDNDEDAIAEDEVDEEKNTDSNEDEGRPLRRTTRVNAGKGVARTHPYVQFAMAKEKKESLDERYVYKRLVNMLFTQVSVKEGIKRWGEEAIAAIMKELKQLNDGAMPGQPVIEPVDYEELTDEDKQKGTLEAVTVVKQKRCGKIKGRTCADGSKQRRYLKEFESVASPTLSMDGLIGSLLIDVYEERDVATCDVPGAHLHPELPAGKRMFLCLRGQMVDIMCEVNPEYTKHVRIQRGKKVLYVRVTRSIYGCIEAALLWYRLYKDTLEKEGFVLNPYEMCIANKMIDGHQCTIAWYVDDNKVSHRNPIVVTNVLNMIGGKFGKLTITRGREHDYLGMKIKLKNSSFEISMKDQIKEAIETFGEELTGIVTSPCARHLLETRDDAEQLDEARKEIFHTVTAKLLYIEKRARPDIETAVSFLTTRVDRSDVDDWKKLKRVVQYLKQTIDDVRIIGCNDLQSLYTWVDAAYGVWMNMRSQTGGCMSMGLGMVHCKSSKQKLNTKSSTESEIVGLSDYMPYNIWFTNFMKEQGYEIEKNVVYQDNQSAMKMEINGRNSCTGNSRHIDIRYFFTKDRVDKGEFKIEYCPTYKMVADYFSKPLQGKVFKFMRDVIMGYKNTDELHKFEPSPIKERLGNRE